MTNPPSFDFSVIVPTRNRPQKLASCLGSLVNLNYPRDRFEVIVVDDDSHKPLDEVTMSFRQRLHLRLLRKEHAGPGIARNHGAAHARGRYLAFTDDDCTPAPDWLSALHEYFSATPDDLAGGQMVNALAQNIYSHACHTVMVAAYDYFDPALGRAHFFPTCNFAVSAEGFRAAGGFNSQWLIAAAEDREFCYRWLKRGLVMGRAPKAVVYHHHHHTFVSFCELHFRYGRGAFHYQTLRTDSNDAGGMKPAWGFYAACFRHPFKTTTAPRAAAIALLLVLWQAANAAGFFRERLRISRRG